MKKRANHSRNAQRASVDDDARGVKSPQQPVRVFFFWYSVYCAQSEKTDIAHYKTVRMGVGVVSGG